MIFKIANVATKKQLAHKYEPPRFGDAAMDLLLHLPDTDYIELEIADVYRLGTGIAVDIPHGLFGLASLEKSSLGLKGLLTFAGLIDSSYTGEIILIVSNFGSEVIKLKHGQKIGQLVLLSGAEIEDIRIVPKIEKSTLRGDKGFGSTGEFSGILDKS